MHHYNENPQFYGVDVVENIGERTSPKETNLLLMEYGTVNSIDTIEEGQDKKVKEQ